MKPNALSFTIDAAQMAELTNAAVERDRIKDMLRFAEAALHRKKVALTHYQEICERRKANEKYDEIFAIKKAEAVGAASSPTATSATLPIGQVPLS